MSECGDERLTLTLHRLPSYPFAAVSPTLGLSACAAAEPTTLARPSKVKHYLSILVVALAFVLRAEADQFSWDGTVYEMALLVAIDPEKRPPPSCSTR